MRKTDSDANQTITQRGFSLVELSIVLVILGLLVGGVLSGQSLIRAAELRSISAEYSRYFTATQSFRDKYFALPGDMNNATQFWGRQNSNADCVTNSASAVTANGSCDGNGNGNVFEAAGASLSGEQFQLWRQLQLAGLVEGTYTGYAGSAGAAHAVIGTNAPRSRITNVGWSIAYDDCSGNAERYAVCMGNNYVLGRASTTGHPTLAFLTPEEAWNIDTKLDDGKPAQGKVIARFWNNACAAADDGSSAVNDLVASYRLSDRTNQCSLHFREVF